MNIHVCVLFTVSNVTIKGLCLRTKSTKPTLIFLRFIMCYLNGPGCLNTLLRNRNMQQFYLYVSILLNRLHSFNSNIFLPRNNDEQCCDYASFSRDGDENF